LNLPVYLSFFPIRLSPMVSGGAWSSSGSEHTMAF
jgi:hypothetical protein